MRGSDFVTGWQTQTDSGYNSSNLQGNNPSSRYMSATHGYMQESVTNSYNPYNDDQIDEVFEEIESVESENQTVMTEALARIEQASLYQVLLNHQLLSPGSARQEILDKVQGEIKQFVLERLEILLGMKHTTLAPTKVELPFDEDEVGALKALAQRVLKKEPSNVTQPTVSPVVSTMSPVTKSVAPVQPVQPVVAKSTSTQQVQKKVATKKNKPEEKATQSGPVDLSNVTPEQAAEIINSRRSKKSAVGTVKPKPMPGMDVMAAQAQRQVSNLGSDNTILKAIEVSLK